MDPNQNQASDQAMTPDARPSTGALLGDIVRALTEHGFGLEQQVESLRNGNRALQYAGRSAQARLELTQNSMQVAEERMKLLEYLLYDAFSLMSVAFVDGVDTDWQDAADKWAERFNASAITTEHRSLLDNPSLPGKQVVPETDEDLLHSMYAILCNSDPSSSLPAKDRDAWAERFIVLRDRYHATLGTRAAQADAEPTEGTDGTPHPTAPSAG